MKTAFLQVALGFAFAAGVSAAKPESSTSLVLEKQEAWAPHPEAACVTSPLAAGGVEIDGNGTDICCGGWQFVYSGVREGQAYQFHLGATMDGLEHPRDHLVVMVLWDEWDPNSGRSAYTPWNYLRPEESAEGMDFSATLRAPAGATHFTVRYIFRWSAEGKSKWTAPNISGAELPQKKPVRICVVNALREKKKQTEGRPVLCESGLSEDVEEKVNLWAGLVLKACREKPQLIVTPEVVIGGRNPIEGSVAVPGPATMPFEKIAKEHATHIVLGVREKGEKALYNSAVLISPEGKVAGIYRKVHLAVSEGLSGVLPGDTFPVFDTAIGRIGCLICMDTTVCESARMAALNGAGIICFPIMGDLRASRWQPGPPLFNESRWQAIMRTRAIDNQVCMVVARNNVHGSCIIDRKGEILAWNEGDEEVIAATLPGEDGYRLWNGGDFREVTFHLRRPHLYEAYSDEDEFLPLSPAREVPAEPEG